MNRWPLYLLLSAWELQKSLKFFLQLRLVVSRVHEEAWSFFGLPAYSK